nr:hypothetical protein CFP56_30686 [Quercus suber]
MNLNTITTMTSLVQLPPGIVLLILAATMPSSATSPVTNSSTLLPSTGTGTAYASQCLSASASYESAYASWSSANATVEVNTEVYGGTEWSLVTYYVNATTLCDGHARVTYSPAITLTTNTSIYSSMPASTTLYTDTIFYAYPGPSPTCSVNPSDCDSLSAAYSAALTSAKTNHITPTGTPGSGVLSKPQPPSCYGVEAVASAAAAESSIRGCGECTMFGDGVELVYFPVPATVSRDMCASEPTASLTHYGSNAVIDVHAGPSYSGKAPASDGQETAIVGSHTFTSGTAYISISRVYAVDRCSSTKGSPVHDVILAMPSESVLSLRYSQIHFQYFMSTDTQTGYPVSYADFNQPIPWSAWNGQAICTNSYGGYLCDVIYDNNYRPQLAIPPEIRELNPAFSSCQLWYGGLYDPPLALTTAESIAPITFAGGSAQPLPTSPSPGWGAASQITTATALPEQHGSHDEHSSVQRSSNVAPTTSRAQIQSRPTAAWTYHFEHGSHSISVSASGSIAHVDSAIVSSDGPVQTLTDGLVATYGGQGLIIGDQSSISLASSDSGVETVITYEQITVTAVQSALGAEISVESAILSPGGPAQTITGGYFASAGSAGLVLGWSSTVSSTADTQESTTPTSSGTSTASGGTAAETGLPSTNSGGRSKYSASLALAIALLLACTIL